MKLRWLTLPKVGGPTNEPILTCSVCGAPAWFEHAERKGIYSCAAEHEAPAPATQTAQQLGASVAREGSS